MAPLLLLGLSFLAVYLFVALCLRRLARRTGSGPEWWAFVPGLHLALVARLAGRSPAWILLLLLPGLNLIVWGLLWAEACARLRRPAWLALAMCVPVVNLAVLANLAGLSPFRAVVTVGVLLGLSVPTVVAAHRAGARARVDAASAHLDDPDPTVRQRAATALARAGSPTAAVPLLSTRLADEDDAVRAEAAQGLLALGPEAARARDALVAALDDATPFVRGLAARALCAVAGGRPAGVDTSRVLRALLDAAREHGNAEMPDARLVLCLAAFGPPATPHLAAALEDADFRVRWHAAAALMQLRQGAKDAAPALRRAMDDPEWAVRNAAGRGLEDVVDKASVPLLAEALTDPSAETRYHVARALARVGPGAAGAIPVLEAALRDEDWEVRMESAWALAAIGPAAASTEPAVLAALRDPDPQVRASAAWALAGIGGSRATAEAALRGALRDGDRQAREAAAGALARLEGRAR